MQRIALALESARDLTLEAAVAASSRLGESSYFRYSKSINSESLPALLNSRYDKEVNDGMKRIMNLMASDEPDNLEDYFADVVKNIGSDNVKVKRMVCIYLLRYSEADPDLALLAVNSIQRNLSDPDPEVRALSLRILSDMNIPSLYPIILHSLSKLIIDSSEIVRSQIAMTLLKLAKRRGESIYDEIKPTLVDLLADSDYSVLSSALILLQNAFPEELHLLHGNYRRYCNIIGELNEWTQPIIIELFIRYIKTFLPKPMVTDNSSDSEAIPLPDEFNRIPFPVYHVEYDPDIEIFLNALESLIYSPNPTVVVSVSKAFYQLTCPKTVKESGIVDSLLRIISSAYSSNEVKEKTLESILLYAYYDPSLFIIHYKKFFLLLSDSESVSLLKLKILCFMINDSNCKCIFSELKFQVNAQVSSDVVVEITNTIAACAQLSLKWSSKIKSWLLDQISLNARADKKVVASQINALRFLIQRDPIKHIGTVIKLSKMVNTFDLIPSAKAGLIWLIGEYVQIEPRVCPDILRLLIPNFSREHSQVRLQILILAAKLLSCDIDKADDKSEYDFKNSRIAQMFEAVLYLAKFDDEYDIRDRARMLMSIFQNERYEIATLLLQVPKPYPLVSLSCWNEPQLDISLLSLSPEIERYHSSIPWNDNIPESSRTPTDVKDYSKIKTSFSSSSYFGNSTEDSYLHTKNNNSSLPRERTNTFTSSQGKKYQLQSLDEFFSDISTTPLKERRRIIVEEESSGEEDEEDENEFSESYENSEETDESSSSEDSN
ncbi:AP-3 complex subunit beta Ecym_5083 [Eremothecium cymbalariae DBVPG|uniref:Clathrin/coatomer adaptor adaptin-like N-terminal domain-containing protein n=1 Tax=Eremothecium cymbalariae (strain CBS 270.75 / DBVPG 7215 / KCTC 17166 / NRRL Y-17582) TaxID=931890 RepID=I6NCT0_ERECY|nr:hypothetical protein Ecym_5083 [Eremothecium cymbalariae DBVPG\